MIPFIPILLLASTVNCTSGAFYNVSSITGFIQNESSSMAACIPETPQYLMGYAILFIIFIVAFGITALRFDIAVAGAFAGWVTVVVSLLLIQLVLVPSSAIGYGFVISIIFTALALVRGAPRPY